ncbi:MAG: DNA-formamidopyrimidine glycosylase [Acholeplasma sp.]|jgi:formamidopyrimidine-DNA glycosylase|nr:MAG: DNA-formamidopyrimidine glycosylase [Acholeplasma sp.]
MPELPEVETVRRTLERLILGKTIQDIEVIYPKIIQMDEHDFAKRLIGQTVHRIDRMGKHLIFHLDQDILIIHLRMEGRFFYHALGTRLTKHDHLCFHLSDGMQLTYHDVRKFGTMHLFDQEDYLKKGPLADLAKEPDDIEINEFKRSIQKRKTEIKAILLDQKVVSGLGNIYVDETLFRAGIHPTRLGIHITDLEVEKILDAAKAVLHKAIMLGGTTIRTFEAMDGVHGRFQNELMVHTKENKPCPICGTPIIKTKVKGRGTCVCPICQR